MLGISTRKERGWDKLSIPIPLPPADPAVHPTAPGMKGHGPIPPLLALASAETCLLLSSSLKFPQQRPKPISGGC